MCLISSKSRINLRRCPSHAESVGLVDSRAEGNSFNWDLLSHHDLRPVNALPERFREARNDLTSRQRQRQVSSFLQNRHDLYLTNNATPLVVANEMESPNDSANTPIDGTTNQHQQHIDYIDLKLMNKFNIIARWEYFRLKSRYVIELFIGNFIRLGAANTMERIRPANCIRNRGLNGQQDGQNEVEDTHIDADLQDYITASNNLGTGRQQNAQAIILSKQESYSAYQKLIIVLNQTKLSNFLLLISYIGLLIKSINYDSLARDWVQLRTLNLQNFQSGAMNVGIQAPNQNHKASVGAGANSASAKHLSSMPSSPSSYNLMVQPNDNDGEVATSWSCSSYTKSLVDLASGQQDCSDHFGGMAGSGVNLVGATTDICYYLLIVTLMDFLNNLNWYHSQRTIKPNYLGREAFEPMRRLHRRYSREDTRLPLFRQVNQLSWLKSAWDILSSPRHLFQVSYVGLILVMGPLPGTLGALIAVHNLLNQIVRHGFNLYRVISYIDLLASRDAHNLDDNAYVPGYYEINSNLGNNSRRVRGWSYWPVSLEDDGINYKSTSNLYKTIERFLMLSQILGVKVMIFTLLIHLDSLHSCYSFGGLMLFTCLVESFLTMHAQYDKYYSRYIHQSPQLKS